MAVFALLRKHLAMSGIKISQQSPKTRPLNVKNSTICILICVTVTLMTISLNEANTFDESTDILFQSVSIGTCGIFYVIIVWKTSELFEIINGLADIVNTSEYNKMWLNLNGFNNKNEMFN